MKDTVKQAQSIVGTSKGRPTDDFYRTPNHCVLDLLAREKFWGLIWEPACGDGAIVKVLRTKGFEVASTDLYDHGFGTVGLDFLETAYPCEFIITNPPFKLAEKFVYHALDCATHKVALFLKLAFLEGQARKTMFQSTPLARVYVYSARVSLSRNGTDPTGNGMIAFAWFVWLKGYEDEPVIRWI